MILTVLDLVVKWLLFFRWMPLPGKVRQPLVSGDYIWKLQALPSNNNNLFGAVYSVAPNIGRLIKSSDGGTNWVSLNTPVSEVEAVGFISETTGYIGGDFNGIYQTNENDSPS